MNKIAGNPGAEWRAILGIVEGGDYEERTIAISQENFCSSWDMRNRHKPDDHKLETDC
jgi:hypothetical protein